MARFEWVIIELLVIFLLLAEVISIRRTIRKDRDRKDKP